MANNEKRKKSSTIKYDKKSIIITIAVVVAFLAVCVGLILLFVRNDKINTQNASMVSSDVNNLKAEAQTASERAWQIVYRGDAKEMCDEFDDSYYDALKGHYGDAISRAQVQAYLDAYLGDDVTDNSGKISIDNLTVENKKIEFSIDKFVEIANSVLQADGQITSDAVQKICPGAYEIFKDSTDCFAGSYTLVDNVNNQKIDMDTVYYMTDSGYRDLALAIELDYDVEKIAVTQQEGYQKYMQQGN